MRNAGGIGLRLCGLQAFRTSVPLFAPVSAELSPGDVLLVRGPNGAGKTTLLHLLAGLLPIGRGSDARGDAILNGFPLRAERDAFQSRTDYCGHRDGVKGAMSARENLAFHAALYERDPRTVDGALDAFGLGAVAALPAARLSAGQCRRLALARLALSPARPLWLLDEPANALDDGGMKALLARIAMHRRAGGMAVLATHHALTLDGALVIALRPPGRMSFFKHSEQGASADEKKSTSCP